MVEFDEGLYRALPLPLAVHAVLLLSRFGPGFPPQPHSGFWIYLTMGNVSLLCGLFALFFFYVKKNVHEKDDRIYLIVSYLIAELSFSSFLYWKTIALLIISVVILNALSKKKKSKKDSSLSANRG